MSDRNSECGKMQNKMIQKGLVFVILMKKRWFSYIFFIHSFVTTLSNLRIWSKTHDDLILSDLFIGDEVSNNNSSENSIAACEACVMFRTNTRIKPIYRIKSMFNLSLSNTLSNKIRGHFEWFLTSSNYYYSFLMIIYGRIQKSMIRT